MGRFGRSRELVKLCWGVLAIGAVGIFLGVVVIDAGVTWAGAVIIVVTVLAIIVVAMLSATLRGIYSAALYQYAVSGDPGAFGEEVLAGAFGPKTLRAPFGG
jgi:hypothetical protein